MAFMELSLYHHYHPLVLLQLLRSVAGVAESAVVAAVAAVVGIVEIVTTLSSFHGGCNDESSTDRNLIVEHEIVFISNVKGGPK